MATQRDIAEHLGISQPAVAALVRDGTIRPASRGSYDLDAARIAYCSRLREQAAGRGGGETGLIAERARLSAEQADAQAMKNAKMRGDLLPRDEVTAAVQSAFARVRARLLAIPSRAAPIVAPLRAPGEVQAKLTDLVHEALAELASTEIVVKQGERTV